MTARVTIAWLTSVVLVGTVTVRADDPPAAASLPHRFEVMRPGRQHRVAPLPSHLSATSPASGSPSPNFTFFDMPSSTNTEAVAISPSVGGAASRVVGCYVPNSSATGTFDGFEYTLATRGKKSMASFEEIGPADVGLCAYAVNDSGVIVGSYAPDGGAPVGFILNGNVLTPLHAPFPNTCKTIAAGINDTGTVVGEYETNANCASTGGGYAQGGFSWSNGSYVVVPGPTGSVDSIPAAINSAGDIVGGALNNTETAAFGWLLHRGVYTTLNYPGAAYTWATAVNDTDEVVGYYCIDTFINCETVSVVWHGFLYQAGAYSNIDVPGVLANFPYGINNKGVISGEYQDTNSYWHSYVINR